MKAVLGGILLAAGILIAGVSGLCTLFALTTSSSQRDVMPLLLTFGVVPFAIGLGLFFAGRALIRSARQG